MTLTVNNDFENHSSARRRYPDFPLRTLSIFPTNDASQRGSYGIQEAGQLSGLDISVPNCVRCSLRRRQIGLDVVVVTLKASAAYRGRDGGTDQIEAETARRRQSSHAIGGKADMPRPPAPHQSDATDQLGHRPPAGASFGRNILPRHHSLRTTKAENPRRFQRATALHS